MIVEASKMGCFCWAVYKGYWTSRVQNKYWMVNLQTASRCALTIIVDTAWVVHGAGLIKLSSIHPSVCPSHHSATVAGLLLWARQPGDISRFLHGRCSAANASSVTLWADVGSWTGLSVCANKPFIGFWQPWKAGLNKKHELYELCIMLMLQYVCRATQ